MLFAKILGIIGGIAVAVISAISAYNSSTRNYGSHTLAPSTGYYNTSYGQSYYGVPNYQNTITSQGNLNTDMETLFASINMMSEEIRQLKMGVAQAQLPYNPPTLTTIPDPTPTPTPVSTPVIDDQVEWERSGQEALSKVSRGLDPTQPDPIKYVSLNNGVVSDIGVGALNCNYQFDINRGFNQFDTTEMYRQMVADRYAIFNTPYGICCDMPDPYGPPNGSKPMLNPYALTGGPMVDVPSTQIEPVNDLSEYDHSKQVFHYGNIGELFKSPERQYFRYGNI